MWRLAAAGSVVSELASSAIAVTEARKEPRHHV